MEAKRKLRYDQAKQKSEEMAAKRFLEEQQRQMKGKEQKQIEDELFRAPEVQYEESAEEKAVKKEQV